METVNFMLFDKDVQEYLKELGIVPLTENDLLWTRINWDEKHRNPKSVIEPAPTYKVENRIFLGMGKQEIIWSEDGTWKLGEIFS